MRTGAQIATDIKTGLPALISTANAIKGAPVGIVPTLEAAVLALNARATEVEVANLPSPTLATAIRTETAKLQTLAGGISGAVDPIVVDIMDVVSMMDALATEVEGQPSWPEPAQTIQTRSVTWGFKNPVGSGRFCTGDAWHLPGTLVSIAPGVVVEGTRTRNGSMINPDPQDGQSQGYDSAMYAQYAEPGSYNDAKNVGTQLPYQMPPGSSLVSSISKLSAGKRPQLQTIEILTCLSSAPPDGAFRPPYAGVDKAIPGTEADLDYTTLNSVAAEPGAPPWSSVASMVARPYADDSLSEWPGRYRRAEDNMEDYGRDIATQVGVCALRLATAGTDAEKRDTTVGLTQVGIDMFGILKDGGKWPPREGHMQGRLLPILFAGKMLGNQEMLNVTRDYPRDHFSENCQTGYKSDGTPDWEQRLCTQPGRPDNGYDLCCTGNSFIPMALAARLLGLESAWNYPAFFDYTDWYVKDTRAKLAAMSPKDAAKNKFWLEWGPWGSWVMAMWDKHWAA